MAKTRRIAKKEPLCEESHAFEHFLVKFGRFCAWSLIVLMFLYFISGFGLMNSGIMYKATFGLMDRGAALRIHDYMTIPMAFAFLCHTLIAIRFAMIRWNVKNLKMVNYVLAGIGVVLFGLTLWVYLI